MMVAAEKKASQLCMGKFKILQQMWHCIGHHIVLSLNFEDLGKDANSHNDPAIKAALSLLRFELRELGVSQLHGQQGSVTFPVIYPINSQAMAEASSYILEHKEFHGDFCMKCVSCSSTK